MTEAFLKERQPVAVERSYELRAGAERLRDTHTPELFFDGIVGAASRAAPDLTVTALAPGQEILASDARVRAAFSKAGWEKSVSRDVNEVAKLIDEDKRLLALAEVAPSERAPTKEQLLSLYDEAFAREWARFLESIRIPRYGDCEDAKDDYKDLQSPAGSPIVKLLEESAKQTELGALLGLGGQEKVAEAFEPLHALTKGSDKEPAAIEDYMEHLEAVSDQIADCAKEKEYEPEAKVFRKGKEWPSEYADRFPSARLLGEAIESFLSLPVEVAEGLVGGASAVRVAKETEKSGGVRDEVRSLVRLYPFASGGDAASIDDVKAIFGSDGAIEKFRQEWVESEKIEPSPELDRCFESAKRIRSTLSIDEDEMQAPFTITVGEPRSDGTAVGNANLKLIDRITIVAAGEKIFARAPFGSSQEAVWSTAAGDAPSSIVLEHTKENRKLGGETVDPGLWSWFRLLDKANSSPEGSAAKFTWKFEDAGIEVDALVKMKRAEECYFEKSSSFRRFSLPKDLIGSE
jgi:type VI protein secretion system component VasK